MAAARVRSSWGWFWKLVILPFAGLAGGVAPLLWGSRGTKAAVTYGPTPIASAHFPCRALVSRTERGALVPCDAGPGEAIENGPASSQAWIGPRPCPLCAGRTPPVLSGVKPVEQRRPGAARGYPVGRGAKRTRTDMNSSEGGLCGSYMLSAISFLRLTPKLFQDRFTVFLMLLLLAFHFSL